MWALSRSNWISEVFFRSVVVVVFFLRSIRRKTSRSKDENQQQTQPTFDAESGKQPGPHWWEASVPPNNFYMAGKSKQRYRYNCNTRTKHFRHWVINKFNGVLLEQGLIFPYKSLIPISKQRFTYLIKKKTKRKEEFRFRIS